MTSLQMYTCLDMIKALRLSCIFGNTCLFAFLRVQTAVGLCVSAAV